MDDEYFKDKGSKMEIDILANKVERITKQRDLFFLLTLVLTASVFLLSLRLATFDQKIVMVPGINREMAVSGSEVSGSYLEETAFLFLSHLLDITASSAGHRRQLVLKYTSYSKPSYSKAINDYFARVEDQYKQFDLSTHFTVKNMRVNSERLEVIADGILTSWYGKRGQDSQELSYKISFEYSGGFLRLKEFVNLSDEKEIIRENEV